jgi:hypothetical protein
MCIWSSYFYRWGAGSAVRRSVGPPGWPRTPTEIIVVPDLEDTEVIALLEARAVTGRR